MTNHTQAHNHDLATGRAGADIEEYIRNSLTFAHSFLPPEVSAAWELLDVGADYGYAMHYAETQLKCKRIYGIEPYLKTNPWNLPILQMPVEDPLLKQVGIGQVDLLFLNHTLEHFYNPSLALSNLAHFRRRMTRLFIAVPHLECAWSRWEGHYSIWNEQWLEHFCSLHGWKPIELTTREFRPGCVEVWGVFV